MQVIENWADLLGLVRAVHPDEQRPTVTVEVENVQPVAGWPNLLSEWAGRTAELRVPPEALPVLGEGERMVLRCRLAGPRVAFLSGEPGEHRPARGPV